MATGNGLQVWAQPDNGIPTVVCLQPYTTPVNMVYGDTLHDEGTVARTKVRCPV